MRRRAARWLVIAGALGYLLRSEAERRLRARRPAPHPSAWDPERPWSCAGCGRDVGHPVHAGVAR